MKARCTMRSIPTLLAAALLAAGAVPLPARPGPDQPVALQSVTVLDDGRLELALRFAAPLPSGDQVGKVDTNAIKAEAGRHACAQRGQPGFRIVSQDDVHMQPSADALVLTAKMVVECGAEPAGDAAAAAPVLNMAINGVDTGLLPAQAFRQRFPAPAKLADLRAAYQRAVLALERAAARGAASHSEFLVGSAEQQGRNEFGFGAEPWLREIRADSEALAVGGRVCIRALPASPDGWECDEGKVAFGLPALEWDAVLAGLIEPAACAEGECLRLRLRYADTSMVDLGQGPALQVASNLEQYWKELDLLMRATDGRPVELITATYQLAKLDQRTREVFDFSQPVAAPVLPE